MKKTHFSSRYLLEKNGDFVIHDYNQTRPVASFFPGIAGLFGIPLWVFYVNRGQCISSVGIRSKDEAIMEFLPANKAYQLTSSQGFRTFIKIKTRNDDVYYEPFSIREGILNPAIRNKMVIRPFDLKLVENNPALGLEIAVSYFSVPGEPFAALARELVLRNISKKALDIELLDGVSVIVPYGVNNFFLKEMSRTIEAWMTVEHVTEGVPIYKLTTDPRDIAQIAFIKGAHFYRGFGEGKSRTALKVIVDPAAIFGNISDFSYPLNFLKARPFVFPAHQGTKGKTPCAFSYAKIHLAPGAQRRFFSLMGHVFDRDDIKKLGIDAIDEDFISKKKAANQQLIDGIMDRLFTSSGLTAFDLYARQTYLDNVLRGGLPYSISVDGQKKSIYVFSRKHGDLERDYNKFLLSPTYFSEGEGNYRDINQNRRSDVFFNALLGEKNIMDFMNLIQLDGYNPLIFKGDRFVLSVQTFLSSDLRKRFHEKDANKIAHILSKPFAIGDLLYYIQENKISLSCSLEDFVKRLLSLADATQEAAFGEGYWSDHWTYNTDLLESFHALYPDRLKGLIFEKNDFTYFDTHVFVKPRSERYVVQHGEVRQYHSLLFDEEKNALIQKRHEAKHLVHTHNGDGQVLKTTLTDKLLCLIVNKLSTLDPFGVGIEMEADRPNWYDSLNGLPGLFGSSVCETFELKRLIELLKKFFSEWNRNDSYEIVLISEVFDFIEEIISLLKSQVSDFEYWDKSNAIKERFRFNVRRGVCGEFKKMNLARIREFFELAVQKLDAAIARSYDSKSGFYYTYFAHRMVKHDSLLEPCGKHRIVPKEFQQYKLPLFLEGFVHALRTQKSQAPAIYKAVRKSPLWDKKLKMYRVNASLEKESFELGRVKAFTPGWLENESIWLHMEYKYLLELLKNELYDEFYEDFFNVLIPFQKPNVYGRSILENSSFIVSSAHPDASLHGAGFMARLSGSTAEFIHIWLLMNMGNEPFFLDESGKLCLRFRPVLSSELFAKKRQRRSFGNLSGESIEANFGVNTYSFLFLNSTLVTYINPKRKDTFGPAGVRPLHLSLFDRNGLMAEMNGAGIKAPFAERIRDGKVDRIEVVLG